jgi:hypothetical protein
MRALNLLLSYAANPGPAWPEQLISTFPPETLGAVFVDAAGQPLSAAGYDPAVEIPHYGSVRGAWPRLVEE